jgi:hypothetical protein
MRSPHLSREDQAYWLKQHIRTRVYAVLASRKFIRDMQQDVSTDSQKRLYLECIFHATWEGQHAAMRWLIEFVGVEHSTDSDAVTIQCFDGGEPIKQDSKVYTELKKIWVGCSKATSHPTIGKHPDIREPALHKAATIIMSHLANTIYAQSGIKL